MASAAGLSRHFKVSGVPALLVYRAGQLLASFVRLTDQFGQDFFANEVEAFLLGTVHYRYSLTSRLYFRISDLKCYDSDPDPTFHFDPKSIRSKIAQSRVCKIELK